MEIRIDPIKVVVYPDGRLDSANAAQFLGFSEKTLAIMRCEGTGPRFIKRGRIFYFLEDLQAWIAERPRVQSSAQARLVGAQAAACPARR